MQVVDVFLESDDMEGVLEVFHRWPFGSIKLDTDVALQAAAKTNIEPRLRAAAIATIEWSNFRRPRTIESLYVLR